MSDERPTLDQIRQWPATVSVERAATAFGVSRALAYRAIDEGRFPASTLTISGRKVVVTASIVRVLDPTREARQ